MKPKRRLLSIAHSYAVAMNRRLAHELARAGGEEWEVTAAAPSYFHGGRDLRPVHFQKLDHEPVRVEVLPARMTRIVHAFTYGRGFRSLMSQGWDLVHCWEEPYVAAGAQIAHATPINAPLAVWTAQNLDKTYPPPFAQFERYAIRRCAAWMACGESTLQAMLRRPGYPDKPHRILPLGVDVDLFRPNADAREQTLRELNWESGGAPIVGFLGRFAEEKGLRLAMQILDRLSTPWRALFVGAGALGKTLREWAAKYGDRVRICTNVEHDQVPRHLNVMDVLLAPSQSRRNWREQFGRMLIEAFACGVPVVGSDSGEIPYVIGDAGVILPESNLPGWTPELASLLESPGRRADLADRGRQRACERFSWPIVAGQYIQFFNEILDRRPASARSRGLLQATTAPRKLLSIAHSYVVALNRRLVHEMIKQGGGRWEVTAVAPNLFHGAQDLRPLKFEPSAQESFRVEVVPTHLSRFVHVFSYSGKLKTLLGEGWDFVHAWEEPYIWAGSQIARWTPAGTPIVYRTAQSLNKWYPPPFNWIERFDMARAAAWICSGRLVAQTLGAREIYANRPMRLIPLGVDADVFSPNRAAGEAVLGQLNWERNGAPIIGFLGRFTHAKGLSLLMRVLERLDTPWRALFVGAGAMEGSLRSWAMRFGDRVRICNNVRHAQVPAYLNAMDVLAAPSQTTPGWREQFGRMLIEAFACGVPVVGSDSGEIPYIIQSTGVICDERDEAAWVRALRSLLSSPARRRELADAARSRVHDEFAWPVIARQHLEFFDGLL